MAHDERATQGFRASREELAAWKRDGFFVRPRAFSEAELLELRDAAECVVARAARA